MQVIHTITITPGSRWPHAGTLLRDHTDKYLRNLQILGPITCKWYVVYIFQVWQWCNNDVQWQYYAGPTWKNRHMQIVIRTDDPHLGVSHWPRCGRMWSNVKGVRSKFPPCHTYTQNMILKESLKCTYDIWIIYQCARNGMLCNVFGIVIKCWNILYYSINI